MNISEQIYEACKSAHARGIRIVTGTFGVWSLGAGSTYQTDDRKCACALGCILLGKPAEGDYPRSLAALLDPEIDSYWVDEFTRGFDSPCDTPRTPPFDMAHALRIRLKSEGLLEETL